MRKRKLRSGVNWKGVLRVKTRKTRSWCTVLHEVTPCSSFHEFQRFGRTSCLHLQPIFNEKGWGWEMEVANSYETFGMYPSTRYHIAEYRRPNFESLFRECKEPTNTHLRYIKTCDYRIFEFEAFQLGFAKFIDRSFRRQSGHHLCECVKRRSVKLQRLILHELFQAKTVNADVSCTRTTPTFQVLTAL